MSVQRKQDGWRPGTAQDLETMYHFKQRFRDLKMLLDLIESGKLDMKVIRGLLPPELDSDAANKKYVDDGLAGKAPDKYVATYTITSASMSLDALIEQQYALTADQGMRYFMFNNTVSNDIPTAIWVGTIYKHSESDGKVELRNIYQGRKHEIHRFLSNGSWGEWEWVNPPMEFGKEYRTINRYNTKSVYTKVIKHTLTEDVGNSSGATNIQIDGGCSVVDSVVSVTAFYINTSGVKFPIPAMGGSGNVFLGINRVAPGTLVTPVVVYKDTLAKGAHFEIIYEYTKTTD